MKGLLTFPSERDIVKDSGIEFLHDLRLTIEEYFKKKESAAEVKHAITTGNFVCADLVSNDNITASFEVEALVDDTAVLSFVGLAS